MTPDIRTRPIVGTVAGWLVALLLVGCSASSQSILPAAIRSPSLATGSPTGQPQPLASASPSPSPSDATSYMSVTKLAEGGHGVPPPVDLPRAIAIDYTVSGSCEFTVGLQTQSPSKGLPTLAMTVTGPQVEGTWRLLIKPGRYVVAIGEAIGCVFTLNVRDDH